MKSLDEMYQEVMADEALKEEFTAAFRDGRVSEFLKAHDCDATEAEVNDYVYGMKEEELSLDDLDNVAGGGCGFANSNEKTCTCNCQCF